MGMGDCQILCGRDLGENCRSGQFWGQKTTQSGWLFRILYCWCIVGAPKSLRRSFGGADRVGAAISRPPTLQIFEQNRFGRIEAPMLHIHHVSTLYRQIPSANVRYSNCRRSAPTLFPHRGNNRADDIRPYGAPKFLRRSFSGADRVGAAIMPPANVANFWAEPIWPYRGSNIAYTPCFDIVPSNSIGKCSILPLSALCADVVFP